MLGKSKEQEMAEAAAHQLEAHRDSIIWYLSTRLRETIRTQQRMMETRLARELEKNRSVLARAKGSVLLASGGGYTAEPVTAGARPNVHNASLAAEEEQRPKPRLDNDLTEDQIQMFEKGNQDMLKHYESTLDKVRYESITAEAYRLNCMLTAEQNCRKVTHRDCRVAELTSWQSHCSVGSYRPIGGRVV